MGGCALRRGWEASAAPLIRPHPTLLTSLSPQPPQQQKNPQARKRYGGRIKFHFEAPCADVAVPSKTATFELGGARCPLLGSALPLIPP